MTEAYETEPYGTEATGTEGATGHPRVDAALTDLAAVADAPPAEQVGPLTTAHEVLRETLDSIGTV